MFQSKKPNSLRGVRHRRKFCLCTDASHDTRCLGMLNTQVPRVITEHTIHHGLVTDGRSLARTNDISCRQAKPRLLTKNTLFTPPPLWN